MQWVKAFDKDIRTYFNNKKYEMSCYGSLGHGKDCWVLRSAEKSDSSLKK